MQATDTASDIRITDPQGANPRPLVTEYPAELPSRSVLAIVEVDTGEITLASELAQADGFLHSFPRWSPDGTALVLNVDHVTGEEFTGSTVAIVRRTDSGWSEPESIKDLGEFARPDWHPTDDLIVFCSYDVGGLQSIDEPSNLFTVRADGSDLTQITEFGAGAERASQPTWTADGRIIFTYITGSDDGTLDLAFVNADGTGLDVLSVATEVGTGNRPHARLRPVP